ncbi:hypothetical protein ACJ73_10339, partial [Blastomyces percursus]
MQKQRHSLLPRPGQISLKGSRHGRRENHGRIGYESPKENENERHTMAVHTCSYGLSYAAFSHLRPCAFVLYHTILASLHGVHGTDMLRKVECDFSSLAYISQGFPAGVNRSHRRIATPEPKLGPFEPRASEKRGWKCSPFQLFLRPTRRHQQMTNSKNESRSWGKEWHLFLFSNAAIGIDHPSIPTGFHRNEPFLPLAAEQEA